MQAKPQRSTSQTLKLLKKADQKILRLFPALDPSNLTDTSGKKALAQNLACLKAIEAKPGVSKKMLTSELQISALEASESLKALMSLSLVAAEKTKKTTTYSPTTAGYIALTAFEDCRDWAKLKSALAVPGRKNDPLTYAVLVIGFCGNMPDGIHQLLSKYAAQGHTLQNSAPEAAAESLLGFCRYQLKTQSPCPPEYLSVFKEFTTAGFQEVFRMLLLAIKPTAEDYNWLVEFFSEVTEFYFDPARVAFVNLLADNPQLRQRLEEYKKSQDQQIKKQGGNLEVTFTIPKSGISKIDAMPPHLRAIGMRLILEPAKFINKELADFFWAPKN